MLQVITYKQYGSMDGATGKITWKLPVYRSNGANQGFVESAYKGAADIAATVIEAEMARRGWVVRHTRASGRGLMRQIRCIKVTDATIKAPS